MGSCGDDFIVKKIYDEEAFSEEVIRKWGELIPWLKDDPNLLHVQMSYLAQATKKSFSSGDQKLGQDILAFLEDLLSRQDVIGEIENAIAISFLELADFELLRLNERFPSLHLVLAEQAARYGKCT